MFNMDKKFDKIRWEKHISKVCFYKLAYNVRDDVMKKEGNYYHYIVNKYLEKQD